MQRVRYPHLLPPNTFQALSTLSTLDSSTPYWYSYHMEEDKPIFLQRSGDAPPKVHRLKRQEFILLRAYIASGDFAEAAKKAEMSVSAARRIIDRPEIKEYLSNTLQEAAQAAGLTKEKVLAAIDYLVSNPNASASAAHVRAVEVAAKVLRLIQPAPSVQQTVFTGSAMSGLTDMELDKAIKDRLEYRSNPEVKH